MRIIAVLVFVAMILFFVSCGDGTPVDADVNVEESNTQTNDGICFDSPDELMQACEAFYGGTIGE